MSFRDITLGRFVYGTSLINRLDPRTKILCLLIIVGGMFADGDRLSLAAAALMIVLAAALSGLKTSYLLRSLIPFKWLIILTVLLKLLFEGGHILIEAPLPYGGITSEGITEGAIYGARIALLVLAASILTLTTEPVVLVTGIEKMLSPLKKIGVKPHETATAMIITIRFIPVLIDQAVKIRKSHAARGLRPGGSLTMRLRSVTILLMPLFTSAIRRAEQLAIAMECRLFGNSVKRTRFREIRMTVTDWNVLLLTSLFIFGMMAV